MFKFTVLLLIPHLLFAATTLTPHKIEYKLFGYGIELGTETRILSKKLDNYIYSAKAKTEGLAKFIKNYKITAQSEFIFIDEIISKKFTSIEYEGDEVKKKINLIFTDNSIISDNEKWQVDKNSVDFLNIFLKLGLDFKQNKKLNYTLANGKNIKEYNFKNMGEVPLTIMNKETLAIKLIANNLEVYLAKEYDYLPILIKKKKFKYEMKSYQRLK